MYFEQIKEMIKVFSENRNAQKIAKKLGLIDKGRKPSIFRMKTNSEGHLRQVESYDTHTFCESRVRIGLLKSEPVKWCSVCESIILEEDDGGGGGNEDAPPDQPTPSVIFDTKKLMDKLTKQPS